MSLYRRKGCQKYTMDFQFNGIHIKESTGVKTLELARAVEHKRRQELAEGRTPQRPDFFKRTAERWLEMKGASLERNAAQIERTNLRRLYPVFGKKLTTQITAEEIAAYQNETSRRGLPEEDN